MDSGLVRALAVAAALGGLAIGANLAATNQVNAQDVPASTPMAPPPPPPPPDIGPVVQQPPPADQIAPPDLTPPAAVKAPVLAPPRAKPKAKLEEPVGPPRPVRAPTAVLQVLDKVTAETLQFEAPVGRRVRYKTLIVEVKACETRGLDDPQPQPSAYLVINSQLRSTANRAPQLKQLFKGWMFANAPGVHALEHPVYDLWLIACSAAPPPP